MTSSVTPITQPENKLILVTGASGYVGGRLIPRLLEAGYTVRVLARDPARLQGRPWLERVEVVQGDATQMDTLAPALKEVAVAYYLIHGMQGGKVNAGRDMNAARNFASAADQAKIERIIYLGELVDPTARLSPYLRSRHETGYILRQGHVPVTEFRAGLIIGSGSVLFEMMRYLTEREPLLVCPRWFFSNAQPIAIRNVLDYLVGALQQPESIGELLEIGGAARLTYANMLLEYAKIRGLKRWLIPTPFYLPHLSAYWVHMVTPVTYNTVLPLIEGLHADSLVNDDRAKLLFPSIKLLDFETAVRYALKKIELGDIESSWSDALVTSAGDIQPYVFETVEGMFIEKRQRLVDLPAESVFRSYSGIGGKRGWFYMDWAWGIRGWMDKIIGGVGLRRGRRHPDEIWVGESLDFWRVEAVTPNRRMRLRAEMKLPGKAWLEFESIPQKNGQTLITTTAYFDSHGLFGFLYWYAMWPFHKFIFDGMTREIANRAFEIHAAQQAPDTPSTQ
ncbi:MAG: SDR family oxidoreductase [Chloroflexi bacterium]|nr:SDR family oxidoreductase [Chloroflexota bacterium]